MFGIPKNGRGPLCAPKDPAWSDWYEPCCPGGVLFSRQRSFDILRMLKHADCKNFSDLDTPKKWCNWNWNHAIRRKKISEIAVGNQTSRGPRVLSSGVYDTCRLLAIEMFYLHQRIVLKMGSLLVHKHRGQYCGNPDLLLPQVFSLCENFVVSLNRLLTSTQKYMLIWWRPTLTASPTVCFVLVLSSL